MTNASDIRSIPDTGLTHTAGGVEIELRPHPQVGYLIQVRIDGRHSRELSSQHNFSSKAIRAYSALVERYPAEVEPVVEAAPVRLQPAARGTQTHMSDAEVQVITEALEHTGGRIARGKRDLASAPLTMLQAMARRGFIKLTHPDGFPYRADGGIVTDLGRRAAERVTLAAA